MNNYSKEMFNFKELSVEKIITEGGTKYVYAKCNIETQECPHCGKLAYKSKGYGKTRYIRDIEIAGYPGIIVYNPKRLRCECGKTFTIRCVDIPKRNNISVRQKEKILSDLSTRRSLKEIARDNQVSSTTIARILDMISYPLDQIGEVVGIDDFKGNLDGNKFQTIMCNPVTGKITNMYATRYKDDLLMEVSKIPKYKREKVKFYICDMNETYIYIGKMLFYNAKIVIDKFHYTQVITKAVDNIRKRIQKELSDSERKKFKHNRFVILKRKENLKITKYRDEPKLLEKMLNTSKELEKAYFILQKFYKFNKCRTKEDARIQLIEFASKVEESEIEELKEALKTIRNYYEYIMNAFETKYTNGFTEGKNNNVKSQKRVGFGYINRERFLKRMMHIENHNW